MARDLMRQIEHHLLRPIRNRMANMIARAVVQVVSDGKKIQTLQIGVLAGEDIDDAEHVQRYGFTSVPLAGAEAVVVFPGGDRGHPLVIAVDDRAHRPTGLEAGEVAVYNNAGSMVVLKANGDIQIIPGGSGFAVVGAEAASEVPALVSDLMTLKSAISSAPVAPLDGGAAFKAALVAALAAWPVGAQKVKVQ